MDNENAMTLLFKSLQEVEPDEGTIKWGEQQLQMVISQKIAQYLFTGNESITDWLRQYSKANGYM